VVSGGREAQPTPRKLARRLVPLQLGVGVQSLVLWVPVEKLFMSEIGFTAASVGVMAAAYAAVVPLLEVPSGILADRSSRKWLLVLASLALAASSLVGGLSTTVASYIGAAMILGVYFALDSGTVDSVVYDAVMEETGSSNLYERLVGRVRMIESVGLVISAVAGGLLAEWTSARFTYFATIPFALLSIVAFLRFDEPRLHRASEPQPWRRHIATMFGVMTRQASVRRVILLAAIAALLSQAVFEFGPLWLVAAHAPAALYGPYWALLVSTLGVGGYLSSKLALGRRGTVLGLAVLLVAAPVALAAVGSLVVTIAAQTLLALLLAIVGIHAGLLVHDAVASNVRAGVSSGVGTLSWLLFLPFSLFFGWLARAYGVSWSGWVLAVAAAVLAVLLVVSVLTRPPGRVPVETAELALEPAAGAPPDDLQCRELVELVTGYLDGALPEDWRARVDEHLAGCDGCTAYLEQIKTTVRALERLE
jgi:predicted MFS family arabinose efflux permease